MFDSQVPINDTSAVAAISYAVEHLQVDRIIVAGHTHCGGVEYCYDNAAKLPYPPPNPLPPLPEPILNAWLGAFYKAAVDIIGGKGLPKEQGLAVLTYANVKMQVSQVAELEVVQHAWEEGRDLRIVGWLYQVEYGLLTDYGICIGPKGSNCTA